EKQLTLKAKGLLTLMLSLPDDWDYSIRGLCLLSKDGCEGVMKGLKELEQFGYLERTRAIGEKGHFAGWDYDIYEIPKRDIPYTGNPYTENPAQLNTNIYSTKEPSTKEVNTYDIAAAVNKDIYTATAAAETLSIFQEHVQNEKDKAYISKWKSYGLSEGIYRAAYDKMLRLIEKVNFIYYDKIISDWYAEGVKGIDIPKEQSFDVEEFIEAAMKRGIT
ncbi:MAG: helix-turn-helix domain-containing protein, partial [Sphaerochaetaceae bacterium]